MYTPIWSVRRNDIMAIARDVARAEPGAWEEVNVPGQRSRRFINLVVDTLQKRLGDREIAPGVVLRAAEVGCNGKRGNVNDLSIDVIALPNPSGARDASGTFKGLELYDIIVATEGGPGSTPSIACTDVTQATITGGVSGAWVKPVVKDSVPRPAPPPPSPAPPAPAPRPVQPYPDEATFWKSFADQVVKRFAAKGRTLDPGAFVWFTRTAYDIGSGALSPEASAKKRLEELDNALK